MEKQFAAKAATFSMVTSLLTVLVFSGQSQAALSVDKTVIERVYVDRSSSRDPGTITVVLRNTGDKPATIGAITVNGTEVGEWPDAADPILWHRVTRPVLKPKQSGLILLKLAQYQAGMIRVVVEVNETPSTTLLSMTNTEKVCVEALRYRQTGKGLNLFLTGKGKEVERLKYIELDGKKVWDGGKDGLALDPGKTQVVRVALDKSLQAGRRIGLRLGIGQRIVALTDRPFPGFRISVESGDRKIAERICADPVVLDSFQFREERTTTQSSLAAPSLTERQGTRWSLVRHTHRGTFRHEQSDLVCVMACVTHATDSYHTSAYLSMMGQKEVEKAPCWQSFIHACRSQPLRGLSMFGQIGDCVRFNCQLRTTVGSTAKDRDVVPWTVYKLTSYAVRSAAPSLALPMVPLEKDRSLFARRAPLATEARQMAYAAISAGPGGLAYRVMEKEWGREQRNEMIEEVKLVNKEIAQVRDYLALGFPRPLATSSDPKIQVTCIDAAPDGLLLVLINHDLRRSSPEMPPSVEAVEHKDVAITVSMPEGFVPDQVREVIGSETKKVNDVKIEKHQLKLKLPSIGATKMLLVVPKSA